MKNQYDSFNSNVDFVSIAFFCQLFVYLIYTHMIMFLRYDNVGQLRVARKIIFLHELRNHVNGVSEEKKMCFSTGNPEYHVR